MQDSYMTATLDGAFLTGRYSTVDAAFPRMRRPLAYVKYDTRPAHA